MKLQHRGVIVACPFCGRGSFPAEFVNQQLKGLYQSSDLNSRKRIQAETLARELHSEVEKLQRSKKAMERTAINKTLRSVCQFLEHYHLSDASD